MKSKFSENVAIIISKKTKFKDAKKIEFGLIVLYLQVVLFISMLVVFSTLSKISYMFCFMVPLVFVRRFLGGYHFKKFWKCIIATNLICYISIKFSNYMDYWFFFFCTVISVSLILLIKPSANNLRKSKIVDYNEKIGKTILVCLAFLLIFLNYSDFQVYFNIISLSIVVVAISQIIEKYQLRY